MRKVICMGFPGVGKTTIGVQFVEKQFVDSYNPTISNTFHTVVEHRGATYELEIVDSAGQDEHSLWHEQQAIGVDGFIMVYSVVNRKSFAVVRAVNDKILDACGTDKVARVLVGNKVDMGAKREVSKEEGQELATQMGCAFIESSAKQNENIEAIFRMLLDEMDKVSAPPPWVKPSAPATSTGCTLL
jgi:Ras family protein